MFFVRLKWVVSREAQSLLDVGFDSSDLIAEELRETVRRVQSLVVRISRFPRQMKEVADGRPAATEVVVGGLDPVVVCRMHHAPEVWLYWWCDKMFGRLCNLVTIQWFVFFLP